MNILTLAGNSAVSYRTIFKQITIPPVWVQSTIGVAGSPSNSLWSAIGYGNGAFVATHNNINSPQAKISYDNGFTWSNTNPSPNIGADIYSAVIYSETTYLTGVDGPVIPVWYVLGSNLSNTIGISGKITPTGPGGWNKDYPFGSYFTAIAAGIDTAVIFNNGQYSRYVNYRRNDITFWRQKDLGVGNYNFIAAASNGLSAFIGIAQDRDRAYYSIDNANSWNTSILPANSKWQGIAYGDGCFMIVASGTNTGAVSLDNGTTWSPITLSGTVRAWRDVTYGNGMFMIVGEPNVSIYTIDRGATWKSLALPLSGFNPRKIAYGNNTFVAIASSTNVCILRNLQPNSYLN